MASQTTQLIVELLDRVSGPARGVANSLRGLTRTVRDATSAPITMADRLDAAITRNNRALDAARGRMLDAVGTLYVLKTAFTAPVQAAQEFDRALAEIGAKGNLTAEQLRGIGEKLIKIGAKVISHGRYVAFQMAEVAIPTQLFAGILRLIVELRPPPDPATA
jgi:ABC-type transporter Mla subunit MlaD